LAKIAENCLHNIDPSNNEVKLQKFQQSFFVTLKAFRVERLSIHQSCDFIFIISSMFGVWAAVSVLLVSPLRKKATAVGRFEKLAAHL
jgi:hypothetical protein